MADAFSNIGVAMKSIAENDFSEMRLPTSKFSNAGFQGRGHMLNHPPGCHHYSKLQFNVSPLTEMSTLHLPK
ncbi:hypothetical protein [Caballeronia arvi]|uniref:hypothetical protein n=1 Tax=Caballeronia arvi TaxID=1777135 RepID=UPI00117DDBCC|nr:hypothetical protein [Caballeronia arvi]